LRHKIVAVTVSFTLLAGVLWAAQRKDSQRYDPARAVSAAETMYPLGCSVSGTVILEVTVEKTGGVGNIIVVHGVPKLTEEAERSVRQWKFRPAHLNGQRVAAPVLAAFTFSLSPQWLPGQDPVRPRGKALAPYVPIRIISTSPVNNPASDVAFGVVTLQAGVNAAGDADKIEVMDGIPPLAEEAERSILQWKFLPAKFEGSPLATPMVATFLFSDTPLGRCSRF
jgi:TonB family protein